jgi:Ca-activated chloride channel family protein
LANQRKEIEGEGIDIVLAIDVSGSMKALDFKPVNRLEAAKKVASEFIDQRQNDRIGIVTFAGAAFTQCPLTLDYNILKKMMSEVQIDENANGTAIGMGLGTAVSRLRKSEAKSKVVVLVTDGKSNTGKIEPLQAAELAATYGMKVYTIGVGKEGYVDFPVTHPIYGQTTQKMRVDIDMETLDKIAKITGTEFARRAHNTEELKQIIDRIDKLEKTKLKIKNFVEYKEMFPILLILAMIALLVEFGLKVVLIPDLP